MGAGTYASYVNPPRSARPPRDSGRALQRRETRRPRCGWIVSLATNQVYPTLLDQVWICGVDATVHGWAVTGVESRGAARVAGRRRADVALEVARQVGL